MESDNQTAYLLFSADCESTAHAVQDAALGERNVRGLQQILAAAEARGTFFVIPTDMEAGAAMYRDLIADGHEVALHLHPADLGYEEFLGVYGPDEQRQIITEAVERFEQAAGFRPRAFRPGYASFTDHTFAILAELGFTHGGDSMPGRVLPECASVWAGAPEDPHYANAANAVIAGSLDFLEIPLTVDQASRMWGGKTPQDLRVELVDAKNHWYTIKKSLDRQTAAGAALPCLSMFTHNIFDYGEPGGFRRLTLEKMIQHAKTIAADLGYGFAGVTHQTYSELFRRRLPPEQAKGASLKLDVSGRG